MTGALLNHLWQTSAFVLVAAALALGLRRHGAALRFRIWLAASLKFLVPLAPLVALGSRLRWPAATAWAPQVGAMAAQAVTPAAAWDAAPLLARAPHALVAVQPATGPAGAPGNWLSIALIALWAGGFALVAGYRLWAWRRVQAALRASQPAGRRAGLDLRTFPGRLEPGIVGWRRPVLLLPAGMLEGLGGAELEAVLAHEGCHVRRRDNLWSSLHMLVEAVFWFHPFVWWIGGRLLEERELACDEDVLRQGREPRVYADAIVHVCQLYAEQRLACVAGISGADLKRRIVAIMTDPSRRRLGAASKALLAVLAAAAVVLPLAVGLAGGAGLTASDRATAFTAASVTVAWAGVDDYAPSDAATHGTFQNGHLVYRGTPLGRLIADAYGVAPDHVRSGLNWLDYVNGSEMVVPKYDVHGLAPPHASPEQLRAMLRNLLEQRFQLTVRLDSTQAPGFALVRGSGPSHLRRAANPGDGYCRRGDPFGPGGSAGILTRACRGVTMAQFVDQLPAYAPHYFVTGTRQAGTLATARAIDATGLQGAYDFNLYWNGAGDVNGLTLAKAIEQQLGLELVTRQLPATTVTVESALSVPLVDPPGTAQKLPTPVAFANASLQPSAPGAKRLLGSELRDGEALWTNASVDDLFEDAFGLDDLNVVVGAPDWLAEDRYTLTAQVAPGGSAHLALRDFLARRFRLATHEETRSMNVWVLQRAPGPLPPGLKPAAAFKACTYEHPPGSKTDRCGGSSMAGLAWDIYWNSETDRRVFDQTGLPGFFDYTLTYELSSKPGSWPQPRNPEQEAMVFRAVEQQLGLRVVAQVLPIRVLVIDHIERIPTPSLPPAN